MQRLRQGIQAEAVVSTLLLAALPPAVTSEEETTARRQQIMKLDYFTFSSDWSSGHLVRLRDERGFNISINDFHPSPELIAMIEREAEAEIARRKEASV
jgi:hypothetical protein